MRQSGPDRRRVPVAWSLGVALVAGLTAWPMLARGQLAVPESTGDRELYRVACASCHGADGRGSTRSQVGFADPLPDFTDCSYASREPAQDWEAIVREGGPLRRFSRRMPAFGSALSPDQIARVVTYVRSFCSSRSWPPGELNFPRALTTEKAYPEDEAVVEARAVTRSGERSITSTLVYERRIGARGQWEVVVPLVTREQSAGAWSGIQVGDVAVAFKRALVHGRRMILSLQTEVALPTGDLETGFGAGTLRFEPSLLGGIVLPANSYLQLQGGVELPANARRAEREGFWRFGLGTTVASATRAFSPIVELEGVRELAAGAATEWSVIPQIQITLSRRQHVAASFGLRMPLGDRSSRTGRPKELVAYILWDWFDGGLFEGW